MPDALSKTVPIWCAVINLAIQVRRGKLASQNDEESQWDISLYLPPRIVSSSEKAQIESRLLGWADALEVCPFSFGASDDLSNHRTRHFHYRTSPSLSDHSSSTLPPPSHLRSPRHRHTHLSSACPHLVG